MNLPETALQKLYGENDQRLKTQQNRYAQLKDIFVQKFDDQELHFFCTPGRTELGGNHTDHNHGRVLAASVDLDSIAIASINNDNNVVLYSEGFETSFVVDLSQLNCVQEEKETTSALIRGIAARFKQLGYRIGGFNGCMTSDVLRVATIFLRKSWLRLGNMLRMNILESLVD
jgi:galactokinase